MFNFQNVLEQFGNGYMPMLECETLKSLIPQHEIEQIEWGTYGPERMKEMVNKPLGTLETSHWER